MRDYPNGGFFFIDAAPIIAAGEGGLKIAGIFEDVKRAIEAGKVFVMTGIRIEQDDELFTSGVVTTMMSSAEAIQGMSDIESVAVTTTVTTEDVISIHIGD